MPTDPALEVAGEPGVYWCKRHRKVKTRLRCGRCEVPICPRCTRMGPTGARCPDCASNRSSHIYQVSPLHLLGTVLSTAALSALGAFLIVHLPIGIYLLFFAPAIGTTLGKVATRITRGKRGIKLALAAALGAAIGAVTPLALNWLLLASALASLPPGVPRPNGLAALLPELIYTLIYLAILVPSLWWWIK